MLLLCRFAAILLFASPAAAAQTAAVPAQVADRAPSAVVAPLYAAAMGDAKTSAPFFEPKVREARFSPDFRRLIASAERAAARDGGPAIDFDPITASQDPQIDKPTYETEVLEGQRAVVSAHFHNGGRATTVRYDLVRDGSAWKIDNIEGTTEGQAWSVRAIMAESLGTAAPKAR